MRTRTTGRTGGRFRLSGGITALLAALIGLALFYFPAGGGITRSSYDLPFALRGNLPVTNAAIISMDEASHAALNQPMMLPWDRSLHARLVEQLTAEGARVIVFDILFTEPSADRTADERLAKAIQQSGRVILAGNYQQREPVPGIISHWEELPYEPFRRVAAGWGNANFLSDPDYGIRTYFPTLQNVSGISSIPWLPAAAAEFAGASGRAIHPDASESRWINYYGPPGWFPAYSYSQALEPDGVPPGFFKDKIVFVGAQLSADFSGKGKDEFRTPYSYWSQSDKSFAPGVEIHATATLNLIQGNWLNRLPFGMEVALILAVAALAGFGLMRFQPLTATLVALGAMGFIAVIAHLSAWYGRIWFAWLIPVIVIGVAMLCSIVINSVRLYVEKRLQEQERVHYQAMMAELSKAADYARSLLPAPMTGEVESAWCFRPCEQLGGDAFGYYWIDPDHLALYLLDVCGHGVGAALLSVSVLNTLRAQTLAGVDFRDPAAILRALNRSYRMDDQNNLYFSAWYGVYRRNSRELIFASGGHPPAILIGPESGGGAAVVPLRMEPASPAVGCLDEVVYHNAVQNIVPGSRLLLFSDGVFEIYGPGDKVGTWEEFFAGLNSPQIRDLRRKSGWKRRNK